jgi:hypothetical protein
MPAPERTVHRGLLWLEGTAPTLDLLVSDTHLRKLVAARPAPELLAILPGDRARFEARLAKLGQVARIVEGA